MTGIGPNTKREREREQLESLSFASENAYTIEAPFVWVSVNELLQHWDRYRPKYFLKSGSAAFVSSILNHQFRASILYQKEATGSALELGVFGPRIFPRIPIRERSMTTETDNPVAAIVVHKSRLRQLGRIAKQSWIIDTRGLKASQHIKDCL